MRLEPLIHMGYKGQDHLEGRAGVSNFPGHLLGWCNEVNVEPNYILGKFPLFTAFLSSAPGVGPSGGQRAWMAGDT